ncbi:hypothetical protein GOODEAATRI_001971 [Goodea atripinnis]|uniref:Uncharacterized protein n=1 Tax=Goodea atripinnis TaxID=208336 RepID=A0ABV0NR24_9TELE
MLLCICSHISKTWLFRYQPLNLECFLTWKLGDVHFAFSERPLRLQLYFFIRELPIYYLCTYQVGTWFDMLYLPLFLTAGEEYKRMKEGLGHESKKVQLCS